MKGKKNKSAVFYSNEVNIGGMGSEILRHTVIQRRVAVSLYRGGRLLLLRVSE